VWIGRRKHTGHTAVGEHSVVVVHGFLHSVALVCRLSSEALVSGFARCTNIRSRVQQACLSSNNDTSSARLPSQACMLLCSIVSLGIQSTQLNDLDNKVTQIEHSQSSRTRYVQPNVDKRGRASTQLLPPCRTLSKTLNAFSSIISRKICHSVALQSSGTNPRRGLQRIKQV
jgi:hypothetical protein